MATRFSFPCILLHVTLAGVAVTTTGAAYAQSHTALAESLYQEGKRLMNERKFDQACPKLEESYKLEPATGTLLNLGACYDGAGKYATAWAYYNDALAAAKRESQDVRVTYATEQLQKLEAQLTRLQIELAPGADVPGLEVRLDGRAISSAALGFPSPVDPGQHVIEVSAPGKKPIRMDLVANAPKTVVKAIVPVLEDAGGAPTGPAAPAAAATTPAPAPEPGEQSSGGGVKTLGFVLGGVGVLGLGAGLVFNLNARSDAERAGEACTELPDGNTCRDSKDLTDYRDAVDSAETNRTLSYVGFGIGAAALATGITLILVGGSERESPPPVAFDFTQSSLGLSARGRW
ncbi:MAG TPA: tetratricopeptide repeat protein [Polyangiaceae bacterium]|nr:tetratricopeptide repeat protein [Polyangiaceae bacterium]